MNVLIIEDDRTFANIVAELLEGDGFRCSVAYSAAEAEPRIASRDIKCDVVVLDLMMPRTGALANDQRTGKETGDELYERIRAMGRNIPVIIITAKTKETIAQRYLTDTFTYVYYKPVNPEMMASISQRIKNYDKRR